uniref:Uncharacterized protein n=1 Tax=Onchocerca volvulus TaxID=6282 RepID=A0A8R1U1C2_ONCVO
MLISAFLWDDKINQQNERKRCCFNEFITQRMTPTKSISSICADLGALEFLIIDNQPKLKFGIFKAWTKEHSERRTNDKP